MPLFLYSAYARLNALPRLDRAGYRSMATRLVPKPAQFCRRIIYVENGPQSLAHQMGLTNSRKDLILYFNIVVRLRLLCRGHILIGLEQNAAGMLCDKHMPLNQVMPRLYGIESKILKKVRTAPRHKCHSSRMRQS